MVLFDVGILGVEGIELSLVKSDFILQTGHFLLWLEVKWALHAKPLNCKSTHHRFVLFLHGIIYIIK
jgi:hypothetical protein